MLLIAKMQNSEQKNNKLNRFNHKEIIMIGELPENVLKAILETEVYPYLHVGDKIEISE